MAFHEIKWDRDDKSAKASTRRNYPSAVVVKDHNMYPSPRIIFDPKMGHWNMKKLIRRDTFDHFPQLHCGSFLYSFLLICHPYLSSFCFTCILVYIVQLYMEV